MPHLTVAIKQNSRIRRTFQKWTNFCNLIIHQTTKGQMKTKISIILTCVLLIASIGNSYASTIEDKRPLKERIAAMTEEQKMARAEEIKTRVEEIKSMDKSTLSRSEKKALKKELRSMNREAKEIRGVYLSFGAIIIIILLLILIL
jgi:thiaminase